MAEKAKCTRDLNCQVRGVGHFRDCAYKTATRIRTGVGAGLKVEKEAYTFKEDEFAAAVANARHAAASARSCCGRVKPPAPADEPENFPPEYWAALKRERSQEALDVQSDAPSLFPEPVARPWWKFWGHRG